MAKRTIVRINKVSTKSFLVVIEEKTKFVFAKAMKENGKSVNRFFRSNTKLANVNMVVSDRPQTTTPYYPTGNMSKLLKVLKLFCKDSIGKEHRKPNGKFYSTTTYLLQWQITIRLKILIDIQQGGSVVF